MVLITRGRRQRRHHLASFRHSIGGGRTPENPLKCIFPGPGKILRFGADVCADPGEFGQIFDQMYMSNPGNFPWSDKGMCHNPGVIWRP